MAMAASKPTGKWKIVGYGHGDVTKVVKPTSKTNMGKTRMEN